MITTLPGVERTLSSRRPKPGKLYTITARFPRHLAKRWHTTIPYGFRQALVAAFAEHIVTERLFWDDLEALTLGHFSLRSAIDGWKASQPDDTKS